MKNCGICYHVSSKDAFLIELPTKLVDAEIDPNERFWFLSEKNCLHREIVTLETNPLEIGLEEQFVLKYLRAFSNHDTVANGGLRGTKRDVSDFDHEAVPEVELQERQSLLQMYCPRALSSRITEKNFYKFMKQQVNIICSF